MTALVFAAAVVVPPPVAERYTVSVSTPGFTIATDFTLTTPNGPLPACEAQLLRGWAASPDGSDPLDRLAPSPHAGPLTAALFAALDADKDGRLTRDEVKGAADVLLKKFDADGDDCLTPLEVVPDLLTAAPRDDANRPPEVTVVQPGDPLPPDLPTEPGASLALDAATPTRKVLGVGRRTGSRLSRLRLDVAVTPAVAPADVPKSLRRPGRERELARFNAVAAEVVTLTVRPQARGWWELLDADGDGQLSVRELRAAWDRLADDQAAPSLPPPPAEVVAVSVTLAPGVATRPPVRLTKAPPPAAGPDWFRALDRNGDGDLSPREFVGTPEQFKHYDADGDGLISAAEADAGDAKLRGKP